MARKVSRIVILFSKKAKLLQQTKRPGANSTWKHFCHGRLQRAGDHRAFFGRDSEWRRKQNMITAQAINASLCWISKHTFIQAGLANFLRDVLFSWKRLARGLVLDEFNTKEQTETANVADMRMRLQSFQPASESTGHRNDTIK